MELTNINSLSSFSFSDEEIKDINEMAEKAPYLNEPKKKQAGPEEKRSFTSFLTNNLNIPVEEKKDEDPIMIAEPEIPISDDDFTNMMLQNIEDTDAYTKRDGEGFLTWGIKALDEATSGVPTEGITLVSAGPNVGKSALLLTLAWNVARLNQNTDGTKKRKTSVLYWTIDDTAKTIIPRIIASSQDVDLNVVSHPMQHQDKQAQLKRRSAGFEMLKQSASYFRIIDSNIISSDVEEGEKVIINHINSTKMKYGDDVQVVVFIDNFHDLTTNSLKSTDENVISTYIAMKLKTLSNVKQVPIICSAEQRKSTAVKRGNLFDVKNSAKLGFASSLILSLFNEVGYLGQNARIYWELNGAEEKRPVLEAMIAKNKYGSKKNRFFFNFYPERSKLTLASIEETRLYNQMIIS